MGVNSSSSAHPHARPMHGAYMGRTCRGADEIKPNTYPKHAAVLFFCFDQGASASSHLVAMLGPGERYDTRDFTLSVLRVGSGSAAVHVTFCARPTAADIAKVARPPVPPASTRPGCGSSAGRRSARAPRANGAGAGAGGGARCPPQTPMGTLCGALQFLTTDNFADGITFEYGLLNHASGRSRVFFLLPPSARASDFSAEAPTAIVRLGASAAETFAAGPGTGTSTGTGANTSMSAGTIAGAEWVFSTFEVTVNYSKLVPVRQGHTEHTTTACRDDGACVDGHYCSRQRGQCRPCTATYTNTQAPGANRTLGITACAYSDDHVKGAAGCHARCGCQDSFPVAQDSPFHGEGGVPAACHEMALFGGCSSFTAGVIIRQFCPDSCAVCGAAPEPALTRPAGLGAGDGAGGGGGGGGGAKGGQPSHSNEGAGSSGQAATIIACVVVAMLLTAVVAAVIVRSAKTRVHEGSYSTGTASITIAVPEPPKCTVAQAGVVYNIPYDSIRNHGGAGGGSGGGGAVTGVPIRGLGTGGAAAAPPLPGRHSRAKASERPSVVLNAVYASGSQVPGAFQRAPSVYV